LSGVNNVKFLDWLYIFVLVCLFLVLWRFRQIVLLVFLATVIALVLNSVARALVNRLKLSRSVAVFFTITLLTTGIIIFARLILPPFLAQFQELLAVLPDALNVVSTRADAFITEPPEWLQLKTCLRSLKLWRGFYTMTSQIQYI
jgi:predicted PurR-regulated permease PerM